ncbi:MAG: hypothetical protein RL196_1107 [Actinomycetota bacterium]|jgi:hypothetical protein
MSPEFESRRQRRQAEILALPTPSLPAENLRSQFSQGDQPIAPAVSAPSSEVGLTSAITPVAPSILPPSIAQAAHPSVPPLSRRELRLKQLEESSASAVQSTFAARQSQVEETNPTSLPSQLSVSETVDDFQLRISKLAQSIALAEGTVLPAASSVTSSPTQPSTEVPVSNFHTPDSVQSALAPQSFRTSDLEAPAPILSSRREMRDQLRAVSEQQTSPTTPYAQPWSEVAVTPMFETSSGFSLDITTNSIVLPVLPDALPGTLVLDQGVTIKTGSIELPNLNTATGSITVATAAQIADDAMNKDSVNSVVTDISPVAASNLLRNNPRMGLAPVIAKNSRGQVFYVTTTSILMLTVGGLLVAAWMFGFIK